MSKKVISTADAVKLIKDGDTLGVSGFVGYGIPEALLEHLRRRFVETGHPRDLTMFHCTGIGDAKGRGCGRIGIEGLLKKAICGHVGLEPSVNKLTVENKIATYTIPQGVATHLLRAIAGRKIGVVTHVGLKTFVDPRLEGCKANEMARQSGDVVSLVNIAGRDQLFFPSFPIHVCFLRGSVADENGNVSLHREAMISDQLEMALATRNSGGIVIAQVEQVVAANTLDARQVKVHASMVDYVVVGEKEFTNQTYYDSGFHPEWTGESRVPLSAMAPLPLDERKVIGRRGAFELKPGMLVNLGIGVPDAVAAIASEEGFSDKITLSIESGVLGGVPVPGIGIGGAVNPEAIYKEPDIFDFYDGGGIDLSCLGAAEIDAKGNVNVSKFGGRVVGPGGFINISQGAKKVCFCGTFVAGAQELAIGEGRLRVLKDGTGVKFVEKVEQVTFSGDYARETGQEILYITERAVFTLGEKGLVLTEIAPGIALERDILEKMAFRPAIAPDLKEMDPRLFRDQPMGLSFQDR